MAVTVRQVAFGGSSYVCEDEGGGRLGSDSRQVNAVPRGDCGGEDAGFWAEAGGCVVSDSEAVAVMGAASVLCTL